MDDTSTNLFSLKVVSADDETASFIYSKETASNDEQKPQLIYTAPSVATSIGEEATNRYFDVYPNPTQDNISIRGLGDELTTIYVYNNVGQLLKKETYHKRIDLADLESGMYYLKIINDAVQETVVVIKE